MTASKGETEAGQIIPCSSWLASINAPTNRDTPIPWLPISIGMRLPLARSILAPIDSEYLVPK